MWGDGPVDSKILLVGEALGEVEERLEKPFQGPAGKELDKVLLTAGLSRDQVRVSNVVRCRPPSNRAPSKEEQSACIGYLLEEIAEVSPEVIVALGGSALQALVGRSGVEKERGHLLSPKAGIRTGGAKIIATYHPAAYLHRRADFILTALVEDIKMAARLAGVAQGPSTTKETIELIGAYTEDELRDALAWLADATVLACDLEWTGASKEDTSMHWPWRKGAEPYSIAFSGRVGGAIRTVGITFPFPQNKAVLQAFFDDHPVIFHNAQADLIWLSSLKYSVRLAGDTMILAQLLDEGRGLSLEQLGTTVGGTVAGWKKPSWPQRPATREEWSDLLSHNMGDTVATLLLAESLHRQLGERPELERDRLKRLYQYHSLPSIPMFVDVALTGVPVDAKLLKETIQECASKKLALGEEFATAIANSAVQSSLLQPKQAVDIATSPNKSVKALREIFRLDVTSSNKHFLVEHEGHQAVRLIQDIRHESKTGGTYLEPWYKLLHECDMRLHSVYRITGARTGRTSAELEMGGSIQLAPREKRIRSLVCAEDGNVLVSCDFSQIELRIAAWFANEKTMLQLYRDGEDLHKATAAYILSYNTYRMPVATFWPRRHEFFNMVTREQRQGAKPANFGLIYGLQAEGLRTYAKSEYGVDMSLEEAQAIHDGYFELYSDLARWHKQCEDDFYSKGYTVTPLGRYRRRIEDPRKQINTPVQATASDICVLAMTHIFKEIKKRRLPARLVGFVHDAIIAESSEKAAEEVKDLIVSIMEDPPLHLLGVDSLPVPLKADWKIGKRWSA